MYVHQILKNIMAVKQSRSQWVETIFSFMHMRFCSNRIYESSDMCILMFVFRLVMRVKKDIIG